MHPIGESDLMGFEVALSSGKGVVDTGLSYHILQCADERAQRHGLSVQAQMSPMVKPSVNGSS